MRTPTAAQLLAAWEQGGDQPPAARALLLLEVACEAGDAESLAGLPIGRRDSLLLDLRARLFGPEVNGVAACPCCATRVEAMFLCADVGSDADAAGGRPADLGTLHVDGVRLRYRLPASVDLLALAGQQDAAAARIELLSRCVVEAECDGLPCTANMLAPDVIDALARAMADADPQADVRLGFSCPDCGHAWEVVFDVATFLWQEVHAWALRMLREIDALARTYHWREADILALGPQRRRAYLELCAS